MFSWVATFILAVSAAVLGIGGLSAEFADRTHVPFFVCLGLLMISVASRFVFGRSPPS